ncbi:MAG: hypothetical protein DI528_20895 [Shinella sp.]|nr:MAG: hypothetical protein DI528_20895 [Shinella sp.]
MSLTSVIIPAYNVASDLGSLLPNILANALVHEIIIVDDCSTDETAQVAAGWAERTGKVKLISLPANGGAGQARNAGMKAATGRYLYFLDADDRLSPGAIDIVTTHLEETGSDVMVFKYRQVTKDQGGASPMIPIDQKAWSAICGSEKRRVVSLSEAGRLLFTVNFPWNKVIRRDFCEASGLSFSETRVHNDVYAHWHIYLKARTIGLLNLELIDHVTAPESNQLSNLFSRQRFDIFEAVNAVEVLFSSLPASYRKHYVWFLAFKMDIFCWIYPRLSSELREEFCDLVEESFQSFTEADYFSAHSIERQCALTSLYLKYAPRLVFDSIR